MFDFYGFFTYQSFRTLVSRIDLKHESSYSIGPETYFGDGRRRGDAVGFKILGFVTVPHHISLVGVSAKTAVDGAFVQLQPCHRNRIGPFHERMVFSVVGIHQRRHIDHLHQHDGIGLQIGGLYFKRFGIFGIARSHNLCRVGKVAIDIFDSVASVFIGCHRVGAGAFQGKFSQRQTLVRVIATRNHAAYLYTRPFLHRDIQSSGLFFCNRSCLVLIFVSYFGKLYRMVAGRHIRKSVIAFGIRFLRYIQTFYHYTHISQSLVAGIRHLALQTAHAVYIKKESGIGPEREESSDKIVHFPTIHIHVLIAESGTVCGGHAGFGTQELHAVIAQIPIGVAPLDADHQVAALVIIGMLQGKIPIVATILNGYRRIKNTYQFVRSEPTGTHIVAVAFAHPDTEMLVFERISVFETHHQLIGNRLNLADHAFHTGNRIDRLPETFVIDIPRNSVFLYIAIAYLHSLEAIALHPYRQIFSDVVSSDLVIFPNHFSTDCGNIGVLRCPIQRNGTRTTRCHRTGLLSRNSQFAVGLIQQTDREVTRSGGSLVLHGKHIGVLFSGFGRTGALDTAYRQIFFSDFFDPQVIYPNIAIIGMIQETDAETARFHGRKFHASFLKFARTAHIHIFDKLVHGLGIGGLAIRNTKMYINKQCALQSITQTVGLALFKAHKRREQIVVGHRGIETVVVAVVPAQQPVIPGRTRFEISSGGFTGPDATVVVQVGHRPQGAKRGLVLEFFMIRQIHRSTRLYTLAHRLFAQTFGVLRRYFIVVIIQAVHSIRIGLGLKRFFQHGVVGLAGHQISEVLFVVPTAVDTELARFIPGKGNIAAVYGHLKVARRGRHVFAHKRIHHLRIAATRGIDRIHMIGNLARLRIRIGPDHIRTRHQRKVIGLGGVAVVLIDFDGGEVARKGFPFFVLARVLPAQLHAHTAVSRNLHQTGHRGRYCR